jgi:hypothetical protein
MIYDTAKICINVEWKSFGITVVGKTGFDLVSQFGQKHSFENWEISKPIFEKWKLQKHQRKALLTI